MDRPHRVLGVLAGNDIDPERVSDWAQSAEVVLAADGGANVLRRLGLAADVAVGDFDSITSEARYLPRELVFDPDQDRSDCDKLLALAIQRGYSKITMINLEGDLLDHVVGSLHSLAKAPIEARLVLRRGMGSVLVGPGRWSFPVPVGTRVSLLPLERCEAVNLSGTFWSLANTLMEPRGLESLSNRAVDEKVVVSMRSGSALLVLSHAELEQPHWDA